jgi:N-acetylmuramoyl-L-alanine amidase
LLHNLAAAATVGTLAPEAFTVSSALCPGGSGVRSAGAACVRRACSQVSRWCVAGTLAMGVHTAWGLQLPNEALPEEVPPAVPQVRSPITPWQYVVLHHSATPGGNAKAFHAMHRRKGWESLGYHFVITNGRGGEDGGLEVGDRWREQKHGAHAGALPYGDELARNAYNEFGIGICLVGNFELRAPTPAQVQTLGRLLRRLRDAYGVQPESVMGHRHVRSTACPGRHFPWQAVLAELGLSPRARRVPEARRVAATLERCTWCLRAGPPATAEVAAAAGPPVTPRVLQSPLPP